jgi:hypothetical protein
MELLSVLQKLDHLITRLLRPAGQELTNDGWTDESITAVRSRLEEFRSQVELLGSLPPVAERPLNIVRALDHWGVHKGDLVEDLASFESDLRHTS